MKKLALAATVAASMAAAPAFADETTKADPFVSTQGGLGAGVGMAVVGVVTVVTLAAAANGT
ncbi:hypothetical protein [Marimonas arenosa]|uniref:Secreted protein n=1 Tax=Marimonas arenosa TaxID=1795305 RepID=A0AAE4B6M1_9RHOB|nr:hypothetical protein [Marimonas arenosa]MDQ2091489.1 hypothetical protein [Marimonas arenosa]